jgi:hypothetical protein
MLGEERIDLGAAARDFKAREMRSADWGYIQRSTCSASREIVGDEDIGVACRRRAGRRQRALIKRTTGGGKPAPADVGLISRSRNLTA